MCSGRSAEELSSAKKALAFAKGPCNKARNSQQVNTDVGMYMPWDAYSDGQVHWFGNDSGVSWERNVPRQECYTAGMKWWRQSEWEGPLAPGWD